MSELLQEITKHPRPVFELLFSYWVFSAVVSGMPRPKSDDSQFWYGWFYTSMHTLAGSLDRAAKNPAIQSVINPQEKKEP